MKTVTIPFDLEMAKKIQSGEVEGKILDDCKLSPTSKVKYLDTLLIHEAFEVARKHMNPEEAVNYIIKRHEQEKNNPPLPTC